MHYRSVLLRMGTRYHPMTSVPATASVPEIPAQTSAKPQFPEPSDVGTECGLGSSGFAAPDLSSDPDLSGTPGYET